MYSCIGVGFILTSEPSLSQPVCQGSLRVIFTCTGIDVPSVISWQLNNATISSFAYADTRDASISYPLERPIMPPLPGVVMKVVTATVNSLSSNSIDVVSTLNISDLSVLEGLPLHCQGSFGRRSNTIDTEADYIGEVEWNWNCGSVINKFPCCLAPPPAPDFNCSIRSTPTLFSLHLHWGREFTSEHVVERYRVMVTPDPLSCSSDQLEGSTCSLNLETDYTITVSAINCGDQEGSREAFKPLPSKKKIRNLQLQ